MYCSLALAVFTTNSRQCSGNSSLVSKIRSLWPYQKIARTAIIR